MDNKGNVVMEKYELGRLLGQGTFAKVHYARSIQTGHSVAIKVIHKEKLTKVRIINLIKREISVMKLVRHRNIINLYEVLATKTKIYFVMEYAKGGELFDKVAKEGKLKEEVARKYFHQLIDAVDHCHSRGVYHRDLKPENILLDENENLKISDFGLSALAECKRQDGLLHTTCGTPAYVAPEVIAKKGYDGDKADIWSCGVILFVLVAGYLPFHDLNLMELYRKIERSEFKFPRWLSQEARSLISGMLDPNPDSRIPISKIKESSWFQDGLTKTNTPRNGVISTSSFDNQENRARLSNLNAFDIISLSEGFDLSGLFEDRCAEKESRFVCWQPANVIISKLEEVAKSMKLKISKKDGGLLKFESLVEGRMGILSMDAEIFVLAQAIHLVEVKKTRGDALEYQKILDEGIRPCLQDIVWDSESRQPPQLQNELFQPRLIQDRQMRCLDRQQDSLQQQGEQTCC